MERKPRRVTAKITRTVTEIALVLLDRDGCLEEIEEVREELESVDGIVQSIHTVLSVHE